MSAGGRQYERRDLALAGLVGVAYVLLGWFGLRLASIAGAVTLFWAPTGIAIAGVALLGRRAMVAVFVGSLLLNLAVSTRYGFASIVATGNLLEALVAVRLFARWAEGRLDLARPRDAGAFAAAALLGAAVAATIGATAVVNLLPAADATFGRTFVTWWFGDFAGALLFAPFVLALAHPSRGMLVERLETFDAVLAVFFVASVALWYVPFDEPALALPLTTIMLASITGSALRHGTRGGTFAAMVAGVSAVIGTVRGTGPYASGNVADELALCWGGIAIAAGTSLVVSSLASQRFDAEQRLRESEARLRALFENAPDGLMMLDSNRRIVLANPWILELSGRPLTAILGADAMELIPVSARSTVLDAASVGLSSTDRVRELRLDIERTPGDHRHLFVRVTFLGRARSFEGAVVLVEDATVREHAAEERAMMEEQLAAAQRFDSIGNLAGGIAHDFNNMLQAITANLELALLSSSKGREASVQVKRALDAAERASALTRQLLAFSRRQPASFDRVDLVGLLRTSMAMLERLLPEDIHLIFDPKRSEAPVRGDHAQLEQVVMNLVVNARDAMPTGGELRIEVDVERFVGADGGLVRLVVSDQGAGVPADIRDRIFEPFFTTKSVGRGTGLGLAVVYGVVRSHGGSVRVEQISPNGARFVVELPWLERPSETPPSLDLREIPRGDGERVLLVEDDAMVRTAVRDMVGSAGYEVSVASNGADAVAAFEDAQGAFDVVVLDVVMPVMGGREAYERLRAMRPDVRVLFVTGYSEEQIDVGFVLREEVPVLTKPYDRATLLRAIANVLRRERAADRPPSSDGSLPPSERP